MAVRVIRVRGFGGERQPEQHKAGSEDVAGRFQPVGDYRGGMAGESRE